MRRSSAPSKIGGKFEPPTFARALSKSENNTVPVPVENAARTTQSILSLIANVKQTVEDVSADPSSDDSLVEQSSEDSETQQLPAVLSEKDQNEKTHNKNYRIFNVVYGKPSKKKHKTWEGDGVLEVGEKSLTLKDGEGIVLGRGSGKKNAELDEGSRLFVGSKEVEIIDAVSSTVEVSNKRPLQSPLPQPTKLKKPKMSGPLSTSGGLRKHQTSISQPYTPLVMPEPDLDHQVFD